MKSIKVRKINETWPHKPLGLRSRPDRMSFSSSLWTFESQTSDIQINSCKPSDLYMCTNGDLVRLAGYDATTTSAGTRKAWRMMSAEPLWIPGFAFCQAGRWPCGFWRHMFLWHTYHTALGIVSRLQRKLFTAVGSLRPCLTNLTRLRQRQQQESPRNNCRLFYPDEIAGVFLNHEASTMVLGRDVTLWCSFLSQTGKSHKTYPELVAHCNNIHTNRSKVSVRKIVSEISIFCSPRLHLFD